MDGNIHHQLQKRYFMSQKIILLPTLNPNGHISRNVHLLMSTSTISIRNDHHAEPDAVSSSKLQAMEFKGLEADLPKICQIDHGH